MKALFMIFIIFIHITDLWAGYISKELLHLSWGIAKNHVGLRKAPGGCFGPMAFEVKNDSILLLDTQNQALKIFYEQNQIQEIKLPNQHIDDFVRINKNHFYLLTNNLLLEIRNQHIVQKYEPESPRILISGIFAESAKKPPWIILNHSRSTRLVFGKKIVLAGNPGIFDGFGRFVHLEKTDCQTVEVRRSDGIAFQINSNQKDIGSARFLGSTPEGGLYVYVEQIVNPIPLKINREVRLYSPLGQINARFELPRQNFTFIFREFFVDKKGNLFHLMTTESGVTVIGWYDDQQSNSKIKNYQYPQKYRQEYHSDLFEATPLVSGDKKLEKEEKRLHEFTPVTREEAVSIADSYVQHVWTATFRNLSYGRIHDPDGVAVETPDWIEIGSNRKIPYQWGGAYTLAEFDQRLRQGYFAGDIATSGVSQYASGVDCSGFVSQCWKLPYHYSTLMMDEFIAGMHRSWYDLQPGDAIHTIGHVRLFVDFNPNGSLLTVESSGYDWRVAYRSYNLSQLTDYSPRYYVYMEGMPGTLPQPALAGVFITANARVKWQLSRTQNIAGLMVYQKINDNTWQPLLSSGLYSTGLTSLNMPLISNQPRFFKTVSVSSENLSIESFPSDGYGYFDTSSLDRFLIVDGFHRTSGSYHLPYHEFAIDWGLALANFSYSFETVSNETILSGEINLADYSAVFWLLGDEGEADETFSTAEQQLVKSYLQQGGKLFVSGSEIGWDLDQQGSAADQQFMRQVLMTQYLQDDADSYTVTGEPRTTFEDITLHFDDGTHGIYAEDYPDAYVPVNGAFAALKYANGLTAATAYYGYVPQGYREARIFVLGFPFETIYREDERTQLMEKVLKFFGFSVVTSLPEIIVKADDFKLSPNYPNPFNAATYIRFFLPRKSRVNLKIYDLLGRNIRTLLDEQKSAGWHTIIWNGQNQNRQDVVSGVYFYQLQAGRRVERGKMVLVR